MGDGVRQTRRSRLTLPVWHPSLFQQMPAPPVLFDSLIDYAGLFPPAKLTMAEAVRNHAAYHRGPHSSRLGRFIVPVARLAEFATEYRQLAAADQTDWKLSVLAGNDPAADRAAIEAFHIRQPNARVASLETKAATPADVARITTGFPAALEVWVEAPHASEAAPFIAAIRTANRGAKIRTGGVVPEAFPPAAEVARFLALCRDAGVVCKATAGLHHPLRGDYRLTYEPGSPRGTIFGFLNVFLAATLLHSGGSEAEAECLLTESAPTSFTVSVDRINWRNHSFSSGQIAAARHKLCRSFGSCSFTEPIEGLQSMRWL